MKYWSPQMIASHPALPIQFVTQLRDVYRTQFISPAGFVTFRRVSEEIIPIEMPIVIIESTGTPMRRVYTSLPGYDEWMQLERGGFVGTDDGFFGFMIDALH